MDKYQSVGVATGVNLEHVVPKRPDCFGRAAVVGMLCSSKRRSPPPEARPPKAMPGVFFGESGLPWFGVEGHADFTHAEPRSAWIVDYGAGIKPSNHGKPDYPTAMVALDSSLHGLDTTNTQAGPQYPACLAAFPVGTAQESSNATMAPDWFDESRHPVNPDPAMDVDKAQHSSPWVVFAKTKDNQ